MLDLKSKNKKKFFLFTLKTFIIDTDNNWQANKCVFD